MSVFYFLLCVKIACQSSAVNITRHIRRPLLILHWQHFTVSFNALTNNKNTFCSIYSSFLLSLVNKNATGHCWISHKLRLTYMRQNYLTLLVIVY